MALTAAARAGFWVRVTATLLDGILLVVIYVISIVSLVAMNEPVREGSRPLNVAEAIVWLAWLMYSTMEVFSAGTFGKKILGLRIARLDDGSADRWRLFLRWQTKQLPVIALILALLTGASAFRLLGGFANLIIAVGCLFAGNDDRLAWHDHWSGTAVFHAARLRAAMLPQGEWVELLPDGGDPRSD